jgi:hypothetical protein
VLKAKRRAQRAKRKEYLTAKNAKGTWRCKAQGAKGKEQSAEDKEERIFDRKELSAAKPQPKKKI